MEINQEYKNIECIKNLSSQYKESFYEIVDHYADKLSEQIVLENSVFTCHDFNSHCMGLYKIISDIILNRNYAYMPPNGLTEKELYILCLSVLLHDISMSHGIDTAREDHSVKSAEYVRKLFNNKESTFRQKCKLNDNEVRALEYIITAHSDIKNNPNIPKDKNGIHNPLLTDSMPARVGNIRAKFIACILRLADELDITIERIGDTDLEEQLTNYINKTKAEKDSGKTLSEKEEKKYKEYSISSECWDNLYLFTNISREDKSSMGKIHIHDYYVNRKCDSGETIENIVSRIVKIYRKIENEMKDIEESEFGTNIDYNSLIALKSLVPISDNDEIQKEITKQMSMYIPINSNQEKEVGNSEKNMELPVVLDAELEKKVTNVVQGKNLLLMGHFLLNSDYCARDWIDTKELLETGSIIKEIVNCFTKHINACSKNDNCLIIGLDFEGTLIAPRLAMALQKPFSYIIPTKDSESNALKDKEIDIDKYDYCILITDAVVTYDTIINTFGEYLYSKLKAIYTVFYRNANIDNSKNAELIGKTYSINNQFDIEVSLKKDCKYRECGKCYAKNRKTR